MSYIMFVVLLSVVYALATGAVFLFLFGTGRLRIRGATDQASGVKLPGMIELTIRHPELFAFVLSGPAVVLATVFLLRPTPLAPIELTGQVRSPVPELLWDATVIVRADQSRMAPGTEGEIDTIIHPSLDALTVEVVAPGYGGRRPVKVVEGKAFVGDLPLYKQGVAAPRTERADIESTKEPIPPPTQAGAFK